VPFILSLLALIGFSVWLLRKPSNTQIRSLSVLAGAMLLYGGFVPDLISWAHSYELTLVLLLAIFTSVGLAKMDKVR